MPHENRFPRYLGDPYLVGLESARAVATVSEIADRRKMAMWERKIYQHPERVEIDGRITQSYTKAHDVYSLGIVLLEIGLWKPLSTIEDVRTLFTGNVNASSTGGHHLGQELMEKREKLFLKLARTTDVCMGDTYASIVENCLKVNPQADFIFDVLEELEQLCSAMNRSRR